MINPYFCYALSFGVAIVFYSFGWSDLYPRLSITLFIFLLITIAVHIWLGVRIQRKKIIKFSILKIKNISSPIFITLLLYLLWAFEFLYEGGIPLFKILLKLPYDYRVFGIPSLHVFIVTFSSFYTIYLFHIFLSTRNKIILFLYLINLLAALLIYNRGMFFFNLSACLFLFVNVIESIPSYYYFFLTVTTIVLLYFFGVLGTLRVSREANRNYDNTLFLDIGKASNSFKKSVVPGEYFWAYIYISSPVANLQNNINCFKSKPITPQRVGEMFNNEILFDFISKRINNFFNIEREKENTIEGPFNVSTVYSRCYSYMGWIGMIVMAIILFLIPLLYIRLLPGNSPFFLTGLATLCTIFLFLAFDNTIRFTGLGFQIVYPFLLHIAVNRSTIAKKYLA
jgi:hypothetical protein